MENRAIEFKKITLIDDLKLETSYNEVNGEGATLNEVTSKSQFWVHQDMRDAFKKLVPHLLLLTELKTDKLKDLQNMDLADYEVHSVSIKGEGDNEGVVISGKKRLSNMKKIALNTPYTILSDDNYAYCDELSACIIRLSREAKEYLDGKYDDSQGDLFAQTEDGESAEEFEAEMEVVNG